MNLGLSDKLKLAFPSITPIPRPLVIDRLIKDPNWLAGFIDGALLWWVALILIS